MRQTGTDGMTLHLRDMQRGYLQLVRTVAQDGKPARPRGKATRELLDINIVLDDVTNALPVHVGRRVSTVFNAAGAACLIGGVSYPALLTRIAPRFAEFDADGVDREGYGPRSWRQVLGCVRHLTDDPDTREAIVVIQPFRTEDADGGRVFPCTTSMQFMIREGRLVMQTCMRSNDVWSGLSGDIWTFTQLQRTMAWALGVPAGAYHHHATSLHIYTGEDGVPGLDRVHELHDPTYRGIDVPGFGERLPASPALSSTPVARMALAQSWARSALGLELALSAPVSHTWYRDKIRPHWADQSQTSVFLCGVCRDVCEGQAACTCEAGA